MTCNGCKCKVEKREAYNRHRRLSSAQTHYISDVMTSPKKIDIGASFTGHTADSSKSTMHAWVLQ